MPQHPPAPMESSQAMKIEQRKLSNHHTFTFADERLNFAYRDKTGTGDIDITYADFPLKTSTRIDQNLWLRNVGYLWGVLGLIQIGLAALEGRPLSGTGFWLVLGLGCLLASRLMKVVYTIVATERGSVWIIQDGKTHDTILQEIRARRKAQLLAWYGDIDLDNTLEREIGKFRWLADQQALTAEEAERRIAQVQSAFGASGAPASTLLN